MNKYEENKKTMYEAVLTLLESNTTVTAAVPAFAGAEAEFRNAVADLEAKAQELNQAVVGKADAKSDAAELLIDSIIPIVAGLSAFASKQKDVELQRKSDVSQSYLQRQRDTALVIEARAIIALANENIAGLADCGIAQQDVTGVQEKVAAYDASIGGRERSTAGRSGARKSLTSFFKEADRILAEEIDQYMKVLKPKHSQLYDEYVSARTVKNVGLRHRKPAATVAQPVNGTHAAVTPTN